MGGRSESRRRAISGEDESLEPVHGGSRFPKREAFKRTSVQALKLANVQAPERPSKQARIAVQSSSAQARERASEIPESVTAELS
jgi:hypothetical protein